MPVWQQRWSGALGDPPTGTVQALWQSTAALQLNGRPARAGARLVADRQGRWSWSHGTVSCTGTMLEASEPPARVTLSLLELAQRLSESDGPVWNESWLPTPALLLRTKEMLEEPRLVTAMERSLGHLEEVFRLPVTRLTTETVLELASRARRIPTRAVPHLSAHSEEWAARSFVRVVPRRVLSEVRDEELGIYENRVAVRLVDELVVWLGHRINDLQALIRRLQQSADFSSTLAGSDYRRRRRLALIWNEQHVDPDAMSVGIKALEHLRAQRRRLLRIVGSPLYRAIPTRTPLPASIRETNLFRDHRHYREVYALWRVWRSDRDESDQRGTADEPAAVGTAMDMFVAHCVAKALQQEGFAPETRSEPSRRGHRVEWTDSGSGRKIWLTHDDDGTTIVSFRRVDGRSLRLVGVPSVFGGAGRPTELARWLESSCWQAQQGVESRVLVHLECEEPAPGTEWQRDWAPLLDRGALDPGAAGTWQAVAVSPWSVESVERVARIIRAWAWASLGGAYPPELAATTSLALAPGQDVTEMTGRWVVRGPRIDKLAADAQQALVRTQASLRKLQAERAATQRRAGADPRSQAMVREIKDAQSRLDHLEQFTQRLFEITHDFAWYATCPCCGAKDGVNFEHSNRDRGFKASCPECRVEWGLIPLACGHVVPHLGDLDDLLDGRDALEIVGCDVLTLAKNGTWACPMMHST